jgi:hypothetical protein
MFRRNLTENTTSVCALISAITPQLKAPPPGSTLNTAVMFYFGKIKHHQVKSEQYRKYSWVKNSSRNKRVQAQNKNQHKD